ncbi:MAG: ABC transporter permease [Candidatus Micrarchaeota archaeon]
MFHYAYRNLKFRGVRSWLTILGIVVGICSVVILVGLVDGLKNQINSQLDTFGPRTFMVVPMDVSSGIQSASSFIPTSGKLFEKDFNRLKRISAIDVISKVIMGRTYVVYKGNQISSSIYGIEPDEYSKTVGSLEIDTGRFLISTDKRAVVIGSSLAIDGFEKKIELGSTLNMSGVDYTVVGIMKKTGNSIAQLDSALLINFKEAESLFADQLSTDEISVIRMTIQESYDLDEVEEEVTSVMLSSHRVSLEEKDFSIVSPKFIGQQVDAITGVLGLFLGAIAGVSLIVGGIGISNTMFMSVLERRKEIGVLKSIGSKEDDIWRLFLIESSLIGLLGGILGLALAFFITFLINQFAGISFSISLPLLVFALMFSSLVGVLSGTIPARRAARLDPVDALRF